ncbi:hypothetical protein JCM3770_002896 [Rhodotorula araucariae]
MPTRQQVVTLAGAPLTRLEFTDHKLFAEHHGWGRKDGIARSLIDELPDGRDSLSIRCTLEGGECFEERRPAPLPSMMYNNPLFSDVTFRLTSTEPETRLFAPKPFLVSQSTYFATLFNSGFSEATSTIELDARLDCSTLHALLFHLHYSKVAFVKSPSHYLASAANATEESAYAWINGNAPKMADDPPPCSPHALYRLADRYLDKELKKQAKDHILCNVTVASAAYEAFSGLSRDYSDVSDGLVAFILQHWSAVKATSGWARCMELLDSGALPGGTAVLNKILAKLSVVP